MFNKCFICISLFFVLVSLFMGCSGSSSTPEGTVKQYFHYLEDGKIDKAMELWTKEYTEAGETEEEKKEARNFLTGILNGISEKVIKKAGGIKSIEIQNVEIIGDDKAKVSTKVTMNDGSDFSDSGIGSNYNLIKENGKWKLTDRKIRSKNPTSDADICLSNRKVLYDAANKYMMDTGKGLSKIEDLLTNPGVPDWDGPYLKSMPECPEHGEYKLEAKYETGEIKVECSKHGSNFR